KRQIEVVITKCVILRRIENFQQRRGRIATKVMPQLVDLIQHEHRVIGLGTPDCLDNPARKRPNVGAPMPAQFRFVMHTAEAETLEGPPQGTRNGLPEGRFPHPGWTDKTQNRRIRRGVELEYTEVLEDTLLDLLEIEVILIEHLASPRQIQLVGGALAPGQFE